MQPLLKQEPVWKKITMYRLGAHYRTQENRFSHIEGLGWFVRIRGEFTTINGLTSSYGLAGPFISQLDAQQHLRALIKKNLTST